MKKGLHRPMSAAHMLAEQWRLGLLRTDPHYVDELLRRDCAADLLALRVFPKSICKELSESAAMRAAAIQYLGCDPRDPSIVAVCPGDGASPRTAALIAFTTQWTAIAVDPELKRWHAKWPDGPHVAGRPVARLETVAAKVEDVPAGIVIPPGRRVVMLACHSHASLDASLAAIAWGVDEIGVAAMGCCFEQTLTGRTHDLEYIDDGVFSPQRVMRVWHPKAQQRG